ncbi:MAG: ABC-F family ATP-binding cassette domain-containing protein [Candidatus Saccharimonadales bacterium]
MILSAHITEKSFGSSQLHSNVDLEIQEREKVGLIGRNGTGKSTLFHILTGEDTDYQGQIKVKRGATVVSSRQEHYGFEAKSVLEYILGDLPEYQELAHIIDTYPQTMGSNPRKIQAYTDALERFGKLEYFEIEGELEQSLKQYQLTTTNLHQSLGSLSGGQKRMVELIKMQRSRGDIILIDEPTNHMDYVAKNTFIEWLDAANEAALIVTHDRDVLNNVDRIIELRDGISYSFRGNYSSYLRTNKTQVTSEVSTYDLTQKRIQTLEQDVIRFKRMKEKARNPGTIKRFKSQELKARAELNKLSELERPSFWIDQETALEMNDKVTKAYDKYKATNIRVSTRKKQREGSGKVLIKIDKLSLGYDEDPLFDKLSLSLREGERLRLHGRNGSGKTTLVQAIMARAQHEVSPSQQFSGNIWIENGIRIGLYEQAISPGYLSLTLAEAIEGIHRSLDLPVNQQRVKQLLSDYLFDPGSDGKTPVKLLSGGQKARLQLIAMLAGDPQILILDEPTNHLDLPSIEELENALSDYHGAIIYVSHDSFFADKLGGEEIKIGS